MIEPHPQRRRESRYNPEKHLEYVLDDEGLFQPGGKYLEKPATHYLERLKREIQPLPFASSLQVQQAEWIGGVIDKSLPVLEFEGDIGVAKAHAIFTAYDVVRRVSDRGATAFLCSTYNGTNVPVLEALIADVPEEVMTDNEARELHIKKFTGLLEEAVEKF